MIAGLFTHYDDPRKARKIFKEYVPSLEDMPLTKRVVAFAKIGEYSTTDDLDFALDRIFSKNIMPRLNVRSSNHIKLQDGEGSWSNVVRALEN